MLMTMLMIVKMTAPMFIAKTMIMLMSLTISMVVVEYRFYLKIFTPRFRHFK